MTPVSTETVGDIISYDVLLWTDSQLKFDLYYRVVDQGGQKISDENGNYPETFTFKDTRANSTTNTGTLCPLAAEVA